MDRADAVLEKLLASYDLNQVSLGARLEDLWKGVVGPAVAAHCRPETVRGAVLTVAVDSAAWAQQLQFFTDRILTKLREEGVNLETVRFRVAPLRRTKPGPSASPRRTLSAGEIEEIERCCEAVPDGELRKDLRRLLRTSREASR